MAKNKSSRLHTPNARKTTLRLTPKGRPQTYWLHPITRGLTLGYRRCKGEGTWLVRVIKDKKQTVHGIGTANDERDADGVHVLSWDQARDKAENFLKPAAPGSATKKPSLFTVGDILNKYEGELKDRGTPTRFVKSLRNHLERTMPTLLTTPIELVTVTTWEDMRKALRTKSGPKGKPMTKGTYDRSIVKPLRAALELCVPEQEYREVWDKGLQMYGGAPNARNVILMDEHGSFDDAHKFVAYAYRHSHEIGLFVHVMEVTGNRPSQYERLLVEDFIDGDQPEVMMPKSPKGGGKAAERAARGEEKFRLPITKGLALQLRAAAKGRAGHEYLLRRADGKPWAETDRGSHFDNIIKGVVAAAGLTHPQWPVTLYALRHTSIVRQLLALVPTLVVAENHNTSVPEITRHYARYITSVTSHLTRAALVELTPIAA